jgi:predicted metal-dependent hydrolase
VEERSHGRISIGGESLSLTLIRSRRRRRKLTLQLDAEGGLVVRAPFAARRLEIDGLILRNHEWILQRRQALLDQPRPEVLRFSHGERHLFLGRHYVLCPLGKTGRTTEKVRLIDNELQVHGASPSAISRVLQRWYSQQAQHLFEQRLAFLVAQLPWVAVVPELRLRRMRSRWGSCSSTGRVCLNTHLIKASEGCIDYVIVHELCHLQEFNHSPRFYALMDAALPNWRERKAELEACGAAIIRE